MIKRTSSLPCSSVQWIISLEEKLVSLSHKLQVLQDDLLKKSYEAETLQRTVDEQVRTNCCVELNDGTGIDQTWFVCRGEGPGDGGAEGGGDGAEGRDGQALAAGVHTAEDQERPTGQHQAGGEFSKVHGEAIAQDDREDAAPLKKSRPFVNASVKFYCLDCLFFLNREIKIL